MIVKYCLAIMKNVNYEHQKCMNNMMLLSSSGCCVNVVVIVWLHRVCSQADIMAHAEEERPSEQEKEMGEETFLKDLYLYMKKRDTPIERIPHLGFKQSECTVRRET